MQANLKAFSQMGLPKKMNCKEINLHVTTKGDVYKEETLKPDEGGGCTTPKTEMVLPKCPPPPPRKPKSMPQPMHKRKAQMVLLDLSHEIEAMFPSNILRDFRCATSVKS
ncbi:hypothetical protein SASPL_101089 [Salvia splendens]|uniref:Uncharacterized protein n=1 Tax=Salvia splendens TaxID=180675 RepID=A0A8X8YQA5_SALSN|nr:hypothetical protein SASPL_101089 [Salvia splendens]